MRKRLILGGLTLTVIVAGVIAMAAFTAQMVNVQARVEKDIAVEPVVCDDPGNINVPCFIDPDGGNYGVVLPQEFYDKIIEVTLSNSFFDQDKFFDLAFDVLWECKQFDPERDEVDNLTGKPKPVANPDGTFGDGIGDCRVDGQDDSLCVKLDPVTGNPIKVIHCDEQKLDGQLRDHVVLGEFLDPGRCLTQQAATAKTPEEKKVRYEATGFLNKTDHKCRFNLKLFAPPCLQGFNKFTDPHPLTEFKTPIFCHIGDKDTDGVLLNVNPQDLEEFADLGDEFKIQVISHSVTGACANTTFDTCIDADGIATAGDGIPQAAQVKVGDPLTSWPTSAGFGPEGIDWFDNDDDGAWTFGFGGDDLHLESPTGSCGATAIRQGKHDLGKDCKVLDLNGDLADGQGVECDLETGTVNPNGHSTTGTVCPDPQLAFFDSINPNGVWDNGEDIVLDGNGNGIFD